MVTFICDILHKHHGLIVSPVVMGHTIGLYEFALMVVD